MFDPTKRITIDQIIMHPYVTENDQIIIPRCSQMEKVILHTKEEKKEFTKVIHN